MLVTAFIAAEVDQAPNLPEPWVYGLTALVIFTALQLVIWSFRNVAHRHTRGAAGAADHAGAPGANVHGDGHPGH